MVLSQESTIVVNPVEDVIKGAILSAFSILAALSMRDAIIKTFEAAFPNKTSERLIFIYFYTAFIIFITLLLAYLWQSSA